MADHTRTAGDGQTSAGDVGIPQGTNPDNPTDKDIQQGDCASCCGSCELPGTSMCVNFTSPSDYPFGELVDAGISAKFLQPNEVLKSWESGRQHLALMLGGVYHDTGRNIFVCYTFLLEVYFECRGTDRLVMRAVKPADTWTRVACSYNNGTTFFAPYRCQTVSMPYGWQVSTPKCDSTDDGKCFVYGIFGMCDRCDNPTNYCAYGRSGPIGAGSTGFGGLILDASFGSGTVVDCGTPCSPVNSQTTTNLSRPEQEILTSPSVAIGPVMDFALDLPAEWFDVPFCPSLGLPGLTLNARITIDPGDCPGTVRDIYAGEGTSPVDPGDPTQIDAKGCFIILNRTSTPCPCSCRTTLGCAGAWPPAAVTFEVSGIVNDPDCDTCCKYDPKGAAECLNRTWTPAIVPSFGASSASLFSHTLGDCAATYRQVCKGQLTNGPGGISSSLAEFSVYIDSTNTVRFDLYLYAVIGFPNGDGSGVAMGCFASRHYTGSSSVAAFNCNGPWVVTDTGDGVEESNCDNNWPASITVNPSGSGSNQIEGECCPAEVVDDCDDPFIPCPTPPCGDGDPTDDPDVIRVPCCGREDVINRTLRLAVIPAGGCPNLAASIPLSWSDAFKAWTGAAPTSDSSHFLQAAFWCKDGTFGLRVWCEGALIWAVDGNFATDTVSCNCLSLQWTVGGVNGVNCCAGGTGNLLLHVFDPSIANRPDCFA